MKEKIKNLIKLSGFEIIRSKPWVHRVNSNHFIPIKKNDYDWRLIKKGFLKSKNIWKDFETDNRFYSLIQVVKHVLNEKKIYNFVECGCWLGHSSHIISELLYKKKFKKKFYIFDSFEGLSEFSKEDKYYYNKSKKSKENIKKQFVSNEEFVKNNVLKKFKFVNTYKGWIPDRFGEIKNKKFSFVHIDVDLYKPTLDSLKFFYPKLVKGGIILCDDYNSSAFPGAKLAWDNFFSKKKYSFFYKSLLGGCFIIK